MAYSYQKKEMIFDRVATSLLLSILSLVFFLSWRYVPSLISFAVVGPVDGTPIWVMWAIERTVTAVVLSAIVLSILKPILSHLGNRFGYEIIHQNGLTVVNGSVRLVYWSKLMRRLGVDGTTKVYSEKLSRAYGATAVIGPVGIVRERELSIKKEVSKPAKMT
jgi:hypothetical protein